MKEMVRKAMDLTVREATKSDAVACGQICYDAFTAIANTHNFPPDFPGVEAAAGLLSMMFSNDGFYKVVAERDGSIMGSNVLDERNPISGVGPITVDPRVQNREVGRRLMLAVMERSESRGFPGIRLLQAGYHCRSLALYSNSALRFASTSRACRVRRSERTFRAAMPGLLLKQISQPVTISACASMATIAAANCVTRSVKVTGLS